MTVQRARGRAEAVRRLEDEIQDILDSIRLADDHLQDPRYVRERHIEVEDAVARLKRVLREQVEPLLIRRDPTTEQRLTELEIRIARLESGQ